MVHSQKISLATMLMAGLFLSHSAIADEAFTSKTFKADSVRFDNLGMKIEITSDDRDDIEIRLFNYEEENLVKFKVSDNELLVDQVNTSSVGNISVISQGSASGNGRSVVTIGNQTTIVNGNHVVLSHQGLMQPQPRMEVSLPVGTPLSLYNFKGKARIGDLSGPLKMTGTGKIIAGKLNSVDLDLGKNAKVDIDHVKQKLTVNASGNSRLHLQQGNVENLEVVLSGNSRVKYGGHADKASLSITDNGKLFIASVDEREHSAISRNGRLTIGNW